MALSEEVYADVGHLKALLIQMRGRERISDRVKMLWLQAVTPSYADWQFVRLPPWLFPLYRAVRPLRICIQGFRHLFRRNSSES